MKPARVFTFRQALFTALTFVAFGVVIGLLLSFLLYDSSRKARPAAPTHQILPTPQPPPEKGVSWGGYTLDPRDPKYFDDYN